MGARDWGKGIYGYSYLFMKNFVAKIGENL
jgi:hypothetical protein